jgi:tRNA (cytidine/uridine-2'-O-)-methyltransferase
MRRAGLDYLKKVKVKIYENIDDFLKKRLFKNIYLVTKYGNKNYTDIKYKSGDFFMFGSEISGLSDEVYYKLKTATKVFIPMLPDNRSINLSNAVAICIYEAWRQNYFLTS